MPYIYTTQIFINRFAIHKYLDINGRQELTRFNINIERLLSNTIMNQIFDMQKSELSDKM